MKNVRAIILYGSAIQTNYKEYNDLDVLIVTNDKEWDTSGNKYDLILHLSRIAKESDLNLDIQLIDKKSFDIQYPRNPSLIYQLKDSKIIYGSIKIPSKIEFSKLDLRMKLDWSDIDDEDSPSNELYQSLRNIILVKLLLNKIVNNEFLREGVAKELGEGLVGKLKNNTATKLERKLVLYYIRKLSEETDKDIMESKWEKIVL
jgi:predicted nucleotidyltransferase